MRLQDELLAKKYVRKKTAQLVNGSIKSWIYYKRYNLRMLWTGNIMSINRLLLKILWTRHSTLWEMQLPVWKKTPLIHIEDLSNLRNLFFIGLNLSKYWEKVIRLVKKTFAQEIKLKRNESPIFVNLLMFSSDAVLKPWIRSKREQLFFICRLKIHIGWQRSPQGDRSPKKWLNSPKIFFCFQRSLNM